MGKGDKSLFLKKSPFPISKVRGGKHKGGDEILSCAAFCKPLPHERFLSDVLSTQKVSFSFTPIKMNNDRTTS